MPLETATYISDLNASNPAASDSLAQADDHMRLIKSALKATFPSVVGVAKNLVEPGSIHSFPKALPSTKAAAASSWSGIAADIAYIEMDGAVYNMSDFPTLGAFLLGTFGGNGTTTFGVPDARARYLRSRSASIAVGSTQANQNLAHAHTTSASTTGSTSTDPGHSHGVTDPGHFHTYTGDVTQSGSVAVNQSSGTFLGGANSTVAKVTGISINSGGAHSHTLTASTTVTVNSDGGTEARPETFVVAMYLKT